MGRSLGSLALVVVATILAGAPGPARAGGLCADLVLSCEDGRDYPFCPIATSEAGEIATGFLVVSPRHGLHMRLVPMGVGYRYIGRGIWFDGVRSQAILNFGQHRSIACTVSRG